MISFIKKLFAFPFFLGLFGIYSVLFLLSENRSQISLSSAYLSFAFSLVISLVIFLFCLLVFKPSTRAYLIATICNISFFSYGHLFNLIDSQELNGFIIGRHLFFFPVFCIVSICLFTIVLRMPAPGNSYIPFMNVIMLILCSIQVVPLFFYQYASLSNNLKVEADGVSSPNLVSIDYQYPDIYYIILDGVTSEENLKKKFGYMDYDLPSELEKRGFVLPKCAFSNYGSTAASVASSLNFNYLSQLGIDDEQINNAENEPPVLYRYLHNNKIVEYLKQKGYIFISFRGFFPLNDFKEADIYYNYFENDQGVDYLAESSFRSMFVRTTLLRIPSELYVSNPNKFQFVPQFIAELIAPDASVFSSRSYKWYKQHLYNFDMLETIPTIPGNKFIYAHFYSTHQPYVFNSDGSLLWPINEDNSGYVSSIKFTSTRILKVIDTIIARSKNPPIIILQADHGKGANIDQYEILNAYYLPEGGDKLIYSTITPVNTFRIIQNYYFKEDITLLEDTILFSENYDEDYVHIPASCNVSESNWHD